MKPPRFVLTAGQILTFMYLISTHSKCHDSWPTLKTLCRLTMCRCLLFETIYFFSTSTESQSRSSFASKLSRPSFLRKHRRPDFPVTIPNVRSSFYDNTGTKRKFLQKSSTSQITMKTCWSCFKKKKLFQPEVLAPSITLLA